MNAQSLWDSGAANWIEQVNEMLDNDDSDNNNDNTDIALNSRFVFYFWIFSFTSFYSHRVNNSTFIIMLSKIFLSEQNAADSFWNPSPDQISTQKFF